MEREWTKQQKNAIEARGGTLLVSAAAGSGKTAVLVERLIRLITDKDNPCDADRLLVVTFTSAAASEMRERTSKRLSDMIAENPLNLNLQRQQMLLQNAHISTIHAFCLDILRENFEKLDIPPDFRIADQNEGEILRQDILNDILEEKYAENESGGAFYELSRILSSGRGDATLVETILRLYDFMRSLDDPNGWLRNMLDMYSAEKPVWETVWGKIALEHAGSAFESAVKSERQALQKIYDNDELSKAYAPAFESDIKGIQNMLNKARSGEWDKLVSAVSGFSFERLGTLRKFEDDALKEEVKSARDSAKKTLANLSKGILCCTEDEFRNDIKILYPVAESLAGIVKELDSRFFAEKLSRGILDFSDLEQLALKLLVKRTPEDFEFTDTAREISQRFDEVLVDEYQDTNPAQDMIFRAVSKNDGNLFMVGDVKQSIYSFRQAMPDIFIDRAKHCVSYGDGFPAKIILGCNFRSRKGVTDAVNFVFGRLMTKNLGGIDYGKDDELVAGAKYFERTGSDFALHVIDASENDGDDNNELEARHIAQEIKKLVKEGFTVQGEDGPRPVKYRDFCILLRSMSGRADKFKRALDEENVPAYADIASGYLNAYEVMVMMSLLRILDNPLQDIPLVSVLLSPVFGFTPDDVAQIRINSRKESLYLTMLNMSREGDSRFTRFIEMLDRLRTLAAVLPADRLILRIYDETGFLNIFEAMQGGELRRANLRLLLDYARVYESAGYRGLAGFVRFIDRIVSQKSDLAPASAISETADVVRIMSIHKSKGLEFPICFLADLAKQFNKVDSQRPALFHPSCGFGSIIRDSKLNCRYTTLPKEAVRLEAQKSMMSEEMRVLYVAMTRAKERLYAVMTLSNPQGSIAKAAAMSIGESGKISPYEAMSAQSPADWLLAAALRHPSCAELRKIAELQDFKTVEDDSLWEIKIVGAGDIEISEKVEKTLEISNDEEREELKKKIEEKLQYTYPHVKLSEIPSKVSVSEITHDEPVKFSVERVRPSFLDGEKLTPAEKGTALHAFMQYADFNNIKDADGVNSEIERLVREQFILPQQGESIDTEKVIKFAGTEIYKQILSAKKIWREFRFNLEIPADEIYESACGTEQKILLQGMADLVIESEIGLILLDYKTDRVKNADELAQRYRMQLKFYERAAKEIFGRDIAGKYIYSFHLGRAIEIK